MTLPPPALIIAGRIARLIRNAPPTLTANTSFQSARPSSRTVPFGSLPAAPFTRIWMAGNLASIDLAAASTSLSPLTSHATANAAEPIFAAVASAAALSRSKQATFAPAAANASAIARPIPLPAPVTTADLRASEYFSASVIAVPLPQCGRDRPLAHADWPLVPHRDHWRSRNPPARHNRGLPSQTHGER